VAFHPQAERLDSLNQTEGVIGRDRCADIAQQLNAGLDDVSNRVTKNAGVAGAVIRGVWFCEPWELVHVL
jgi:hypothetical protein